jgi:hypothetical protein
MDAAFSGTSANETGGASRIIGVILDDFPVRQRYLDLGNREIVIAPFLVGMAAINVIARKYPIGDPLDFHSRDPVAVTRDFS